MEEGEQAAWGCQSPGLRPGRQGRQEHPAKKTQRIRETLSEAIPKFTKAGFSHSGHSGHPDLS